MVIRNASKFFIPAPALAPSRVAFESWLRGEIPAVVVENFLDPEGCRYFARAALRAGFERYANAPEVGLLGPALVDHPDLPEYLQLAELFATRGLLLRQGRRLLYLVAGLLAESTVRRVEILAHEGRPFFAGNFRLLTGGAAIHADDLAYDCPAMRSVRLDFQGGLRPAPDDDREGGRDAHLR